MLESIEELFCLLSLCWVICKHFVIQLTQIFAFPLTLTELFDPMTLTMTLAIKIAYLNDERPEGDEVFYKHIMLVVKY